MPGLRRNRFYTLPRARPQTNQKGLTGDGREASCGRRPNVNWRRLKILLPTFRIAAQIHDRHDQNLIWPHLIEQAKRKPVHPATPGSGRHRRPRQRMGFHQPGCHLHFREKIRSQSFLSRFVELHRFFEFTFRRRSEPHFHFRSPFFNSANTAWASRAFSVPDS